LANILIAKWQVLSEFFVDNEWERTAISRSDGKMLLEKDGEPSEALCLIQFCPNPLNKDLRYEQSRQYKGERGNTHF
jgi:hypothetical protein